jgi:hypothetical protein
MKALNPSPASPESTTCTLSRGLRCSSTLSWYFPPSSGVASVAEITCSRTRTSAERAPRARHVHAIGSNSMNTAGNRCAFWTGSWSISRFHRLMNCTPIPMLLSRSATAL